MLDQLPFFTPDHRNLVQSVTTFAEREIEPFASQEHDVEQLARHYVSILAQADLLQYSVPNGKHDTRTLCLIRESLSYSSSLADLAFVMQGLGTFAISRAAPDH